MIRVEVDVSGLEEVERKLGKMKDQAPKVLRSAINSTATEARKQLAQEAQSRYTVKNAGFNSAAKINDRDRRWINSWFPQKGDRLQPTIATFNWERDGQKGKFPCGTFLVDDFSFKGGPIRLDLEGLALPAVSGFKATERTETYESTTLKEIGQIVAARAKVALHYEAGAVSIEKVEQNNQTDCAFFGSLVEKYGYALKIYNDKLVVFDEGKYEAKPPKFILTEKDFEPGWSWNTKLDQTYTGVKYQYTNSEKNRTFTVTAGGGGRILEVNDAAENLGEATLIALAALNKNYEIPETPEYSEEIRELQDSDPASASGVFTDTSRAAANHSHTAANIGAASASDVTAINNRLNAKEADPGEVVMAAHMKKQVGKAKNKKDFSKKLVSDIRWLLWAVTLGGLLLAGYCIYKGYEGSLPWLSAMVGLPWTAHGVVCSFYLNMAKSDHKEGGITFESAKANSFMTDENNTDSPMG